MNPYGYIGAFLLGAYALAIIVTLATCALREFFTPKGRHHRLTPDLPDRPATPPPAAPARSRPVHEPRALRAIPPPVPVGAQGAPIARPRHATPAGAAVG